MILTGKAEELFNKWYDKTYSGFHTYDTNNWSEIPESMQWGVYQEFFITQKLLINVTISFSKTKPHCAKIFEDISDKSRFDLDLKFNVLYKTREEAMVKVIEKANELLNNN